jgi:DNA-directed RNA polymerase specialized sigma24 family protein
MRYKDIAVLVGKTPGAVKIAIYRLLNRLKENMEKTDG